MAILDMLGQQLQGDTLTQISRQLGTDEGTTAKAVSVALPLMLGGLSRNVSSQQGAAQLDQALTRDHDGSLLDTPHRALADPSAFNAGGILGHIFGQKQAPVEQGVAKATGLDPQRAGKLLMILAPLVMAALARARSNKGAGGSAADVLRQENSSLEREVPGGLGGLASILDRDHDGSVVDDIAGLAKGGLGGMLGGQSGGLGGMLGGILGDRR